jgi:hypothetical protein
MRSVELARARQRAAARAGRLPRRLDRSPRASTATSTALDFDAAALLRLLERCDALRRPTLLEQVLDACEADHRGRAGLQDDAVSAASRLLDAWRRRALWTPAPSPRAWARDGRGAHRAGGACAARRAAAPSRRRAQMPEPSADQEHQHRQQHACWRTARNSRAADAEVDVARQRPMPSLRSHGCSAVSTTSAMNIGQQPAHPRPSKACACDRHGRSLAAAHRCRGRPQAP